MNEEQHIAWLVDCYRDGCLGTEERGDLARSLERDLGFAGAFLDEVRRQGRLAGLFARRDQELWRQISDSLSIGSSTRMADRVMARVAPVRRRRLAWGLAAGLVAAAILGLVELTRHAPPAVMVAMEDDRTTTNTSSRAAAGSRLVCNLDQRARMDFSDGTRLELGSGGDVRLDGYGRAGTQLTLASGPLDAIVAKQQSGAHFVVNTSDAVVTAIGTRFTTVHLPWGTRVEVDEGRVLTRRSRDGAEVLVEAGSWVQVRPDGPIITHHMRPAISATTRSFIPVADSVVVGGRFATSNRGHYKSHILTSPLVTADEQRMFFITFDLADLQRPVLHAGLRMHIEKLHHPGMRLEVALVDQSWQEDAITWSNCPPAGAVVASWTPGPDDEPIDLTAAVAAAAGGRLSLRIRAVDGTPVDAVVGFNTREASPGRQPLLVVDLSQSAR